MSAPEHPYEVRVERGRVAEGSILAVVVVGLLVLASSLLVTWLLLPKPIPLTSVYGREAPRQIAGINQTLILADPTGEQLIEAQRRELDSYGWVDRDSGLVRIPIERAMQLVAEEQP